MNEELILEEESLSARRAWIEISQPSKQRRLKSSLSARRAWIEIFWGSDSLSSKYVALRKESVDRNDLIPSNGTFRSTVALRKESVDRNVRVIEKAITFYRRSPQGERG